LVNFINKEIQIRDSFDTVQYKFFLIPDYQANKGLLLLKVHHSFGDGTAVSTFLLSLSDRFDAKNLLGMKPFGFLK